MLIAISNGQLTDWVSVAARWPRSERAGGNSSGCGSCPKQSGSGLNGNSRSTAFGTKRA